MPNTQDLRHFLHFTLVFNVIVVWFDFCPEDPLLYFSLHDEVPINWEFENLLNAAAAAAKSLELCLTLCDPIDSSPPGSAFLGFSRQEHWHGLSFLSPMHESETRKWSHSIVSDFVTPWPVAYQAPPPVGFSSQEYWSGLPLPSLFIKWTSHNGYWYYLMTNFSWLLSV